MASKHIPWDAFSSVPRDASKLELSDDEDEFAVKTGEITLTEPADPRARAHESAQAASKPGETAIVPSNGWVPGTLGKPGYQRILTDEEMNAGGGMGAMDLDDWKVTAMEKVHEGTTLDASGGAKTIMKTLLEAGEGTDTAHWPVQVEVTYTGKVRELGDTGAEGGVFDEEHATTPCIFDLRERFDLQVADARFDVIRPVGLMRGIGTMKLGERSRLTLKPEMGFGAEGDASLGVPESATLEYEVRVHRLIKTQVWEDGAIYKRRLITGPAEVKRDCAGRGLQLHTPQPNAEVLLRWGGALEEDGFEFRAQAEQQFWLGDPAFPDFWPRFLNSFRVGETSEVTLTSDLAFGDDGSMEHEVPPEAPVRLTITLLDFVPIADLSDKAPAPLEPRSALKRVTQRGRGFRYASFRYACALELSARRLEGPGLAGVQATRAAASAPLLDGVSLVHTCGAVHGAGSAELAAQEEVRAACGGADLAAALELLLPTMELYEEAELQCAPGWVGGAHEHGILLRVKLRSWVRVDPIEATGGAVWKTVLAESEAAEVVVPNLESRVSVRYSVRSSPGEDGVSLDLFASGETPVEFTQGAVRGGREILPCIDASITSFRVGEYARLEIAVYLRSRRGVLMTAGTFPIGMPASSARQSSATAPHSSTRPPTCTPTPAPRCSSTWSVCPACPRSTGTT